MIFSRRSEYAVMSYGFSADLSSMKSPNEVSSPSPTGDWSEIGCCAIFMICWTRSTGRFISSATSSGVGSWPYAWSSCFWTCMTLFRVSIMWTGMRMVRAWSAIDRLADPPGRVGGELVTPAVLELLHRLHQAHVALLDQVQEREAAVGVFLRDRDHQPEVGLDHLGLGAVGLADVGHRVVEDLDQAGGRDPLLELDVAQPVVDRPGADRGVLLRLRVLGALELDVGRLDLLEDGPHLLEILLVDLQLEVELREVRPERGIAPAELRKGPLAVRLAAGLRLLDPGLGHPGLVLLRRLDQLGQRPEVGVAALDLLVDDDPVEPLLAVEQLGAEDGDVAAHRRCVEKGLLGLELGVLDPLRDLDLLLARQERHLPHLLEVHPHRVVEDVVLRRAGLLLLGLLLALLVILNLVGLQDLDLKVLEDGEDVIDLLLVLDRLGQRLVDVVERQVPLLLRKPDKLADLLVDAPDRDRGIAGLGRRLRDVGERVLDGFGMVVVALFGFARHVGGGQGITKRTPYPAAVSETGWRSWRCRSDNSLSSDDGSSLKSDGVLANASSIWRIRGPSARSRSLRIPSRATLKGSSSTGTSKSRDATSDFSSSLSISASRWSRPGQLPFSSSPRNRFRRMPAVCPWSIQSWGMAALSGRPSVSKCRHRRSRSCSGATVAGSRVAGGAEGGRAGERSARPTSRLRSLWSA